jgi:hypothetical protein
MSIRRARASGAPLAFAGRRLGPGAATAQLRALATEDKARQDTICLLNNFWLPGQSRWAVPTSRPPECWRLRCGGVNSAACRRLLGTAQRDDRGPSQARSPKGDCTTPDSARAPFSLPLRPLTHTHTHKYPSACRLTRLLPCPETESVRLGFTSFPLALSPTKRLSQARRARATACAG